MWNWDTSEKANENGVAAPRGDTEHPRQAGALTAEGPSPAACVRGRQWRPSGVVGYEIYGIPYEGAPLVYLGFTKSLDKMAPVHRVETTE
jgi:hypothetical protein